MCKGPINLPAALGWEEKDRRRVVDRGCQCWVLGLRGVFMSVHYFISLISLVKEKRVMAGTLRIVCPEAMIMVSPITCI